MSQLDEFMEDTNNLKKLLSQIFSPEIVAYIIQLVINDNAHKKIENLYKEY